MIIKSGYSEKKISESDFFNYLRYGVLEFADEEVDVMNAQFLLSWVFQITSIYIGFDADNSWLDVSCGNKSIRLYNTGIEQYLIDEYHLNE